MNPLFFRDPLIWGNTSSADPPSVQPLKEDSKSTPAPILDLSGGPKSPPFQIFEPDDTSSNNSFNRVLQPGLRQPKKNRELLPNVEGEKMSKNSENKTVFTEKRSKSFNKPLLRDRNKTIKTQFHYVMSNVHKYILSRIFEYRYILKGQGHEI